MMFPPRPNAIVTMLTSDDFLAGVQTMLYSVKKSSIMNNNTDNNYPPELVVMVTSNVSKKTRTALCPIYCTRVIEVDPISFPENNNTNEKKEECHVKSWTSGGGALTKLHIFRLDIYGVIVYIDADCLVVKDISHMFDWDKTSSSSKQQQQKGLIAAAPDTFPTEDKPTKGGLIAAAPDIFPPDKFNAGVMIVRPNQSVFNDMMDKTSTLTSYDGGDTGFLNSYYSNWYNDDTTTTSSRRLKFGYNAQQFLYNCTYEKQPNYWKMCVEPDLHILHFSSSPKPWEKVNGTAKEGEEESIDQYLQPEDMENLTKATKTKELDNLWWKHYNDSKKYVETYRCEQADSEQKRKEIRKANKKLASMSPKELTKVVAKRYKELRQEGKDSSDAMKISRREYKMDKDENSSPSAGSQVAAMFGMQ